jgi:hypothetical protein
LRTSQVFVRAGSLDDLGEALRLALQKVGRPAEERTLIALWAAGWGTVVEERLDARLAQSLSEQLGMALALELDGGALALSMRSWNAGEPGEEERDPAPPRFRDVEAVAWEVLEYLGVPPALRLLPLGQIELRQDGQGVPAVLAQADPQRSEMSPVLAVPPLRTEELPVDPDVVVESAAGEARAVEVRNLPEGIPNETWAETLAEIEEAQSRRLLRALSHRDEPRVPRPTFAYRTLQALRMEKLLAQARQRRPWLARLLDPEREPPLSRAGFTALCRARLAAELPEAKVARAHGTHLELLVAPETCVRAPVQELYEKKIIFSLDEEGAAGGLVARVRELLSQPVPPVAEWNGALEGLLPTILSGDPAGRAAVPIAPGFYAALLCDDGQRIAPVQRRDLEALRVSPDEAIERALANAEALTGKFPESVRWFDAEQGRVISCDFADPGGAGRLLSATMRDLLLRILDEPRACAATPTRDSLLACAAHDPQAEDWLRDEARRRFEEGPFPIDPRLWLITADSLQPV